MTDTTQPPVRIWAYEQSGSMVRLWRANNDRAGSHEYTLTASIPRDLQDAMEREQALMAQIEILRRELAQFRGEAAQQEDFLYQASEALEAFQAMGQAWDAGGGE